MVVEIKNILKPDAKLRVRKLTLKEVKELNAVAMKWDEEVRKKRISDIDWWVKNKDIPMSY